jgi:hypothetical protein
LKKKLNSSFGFKKSIRNPLTSVDKLNLVIFCSKNYPVFINLSMLSTYNFFSVSYIFSKVGKQINFKKKHEMDEND